MDTVPPHHGTENLLSDFLCLKCNKPLQSDHCRTNIAEVCPNCNIMVHPHNQSAKPEHQQYNKIQLGLDFFCANCNNSWQSVSDRVNREGDACPKCSKMVYPYKQINLTPCKIWDVKYGDFFCINCKKNFQCIIDRVNKTVACPNCCNMVFPRNLGNLIPSRRPPADYILKEFLCIKCNKSWKSTNHRINTADICPKCEHMVYPHKQSTLTPNKDNARDSQPLYFLCTKCNKSWQSCTDTTNKVESCPKCENLVYSYNQSDLMPCPGRIKNKSSEFDASWSWVNKTDEGQKYDNMRFLNSKIIIMDRDENIRMENLNFTHFPQSHFEADRIHKAEENSKCNNLVYSYSQSNITSNKGIAIELDRSSAPSNNESSELDADECPKCKEVANLNKQSDLTSCQDKGIQLDDFYCSNTQLCDKNCESDTIGIDKMDSPTHTSSNMACLLKQNNMASCEDNDTSRMENLLQLKSTPRKDCISQRERSHNKTWGWRNLIKSWNFRKRKSRRQYSERQNL